MYALLHELIDVNIKTPRDLPAKLVKQASELLPEFAVAKFEAEPRISEYMAIKQYN